MEIDVHEGRCEPPELEGSSQPSVPGPVPVAGALPEVPEVPDDPMGAFFQDRPAVDLKAIRKSPSELKKARENLRSDTSEEEDLELAEFCTACGSSDCWRDKDLCTYQKKAEVDDMMILGFFSVFKTRPDAFGWCGDHGMVAVHEMLAERGKRREIRQKQKAAAYAKRRKSTGVNLERMMAPETPREYAGVARVIDNSTLSFGGTALELKKGMEEMVSRGQEYKEGTGADTLLRAASLNSLSRAIASWRSCAVPVFRESKPFVLEFLSKVSPNNFAATEWALPACRKIMLGYDARLAILTKGVHVPIGTSWKALEDSQPSVPGPVPVVGAASEPSSKAAIAEAAAQLKKAWQTKEYSITLARLQSGDVKMTVWACQQKYRREHHLKLQRLRTVYASTGAHKAVCSEVLGQSGAGVRNLTRDLAAADAEADGLVASEGERLELSGPELKKALKAEEAREKERGIADKASLDALYDPGTWRCSRCKSALPPSTIDCPCFVRRAGNLESRFGNASFKRCGGSQSETWGGYVRGADSKPPPGRSKRDEDPNWRGKYSGGSRSQRAKAKTELTEEETRGECTDQDRAEVVQKVLEARTKIKDMRLSKKQRTFAGKRAEVMADPDKWECPRCVEEFSDDDNASGCGWRDVYNRSTNVSCWKCSIARPGPYTAQGIRWKCPDCSTDVYSICGDQDDCPDCGRPYRKKDDFWWRIPDPPATSSSAGASADTRKKGRKRAGKKHKKLPPQSSESGPGPAADAGNRWRTHDEPESGSEGSNPFEKTTRTRTGQEKEPSIASASSLVA